MLIVFFWIAFIDFILECCVSLGWQFSVAPALSRHSKCRAVMASGLLGQVAVPLSRGVLLAPGQRERLGQTSAQQGWLDLASRRELPWVRSQQMRAALNPALRPWDVLGLARACWVVANQEHRVQRCLFAFSVSSDSSRLIFHSVKHNLSSRVI